MPAKVLFQRVLTKLVCQIHDHSTAKQVLCGFDGRVYYKQSKYMYNQYYNDIYITTVVLSNI